MKVENIYYYINTSIYIKLKSFREFVNLLIFGIIHYILIYIRINCSIFYFTTSGLRTTNSVLLFNWCSSSEHFTPFEHLFTSFVSPIDGSVISDRKQYRDHCKKHGVVPASEFSPEFLERKAKERTDHYTGNRTKEQRLEIRRELYENMIRAERDAGW